MIRFSIDSNITDLIKWVEEIPSVVAFDRVAESCARIFAERARARLAASGALQEDINRFVSAITFEKVGESKWRISAGKYGDDQLKDDMYYLEFGTGIVGANKPHPEASKYGWKYDINKHGDSGWTFRRGIRFGNQNAFIAKDDIVHRYKRKQHAGARTGWNAERRRTQDHEVGSDKSIQTKGVIAVRYFYDTMLEFDDILNQALKENGS